MKINIIPRSKLSIILPIGLIFFLFLFSNKQTAKEITDCRPKPEQDLISNEYKQRGAHVFGIVDSTDFRPLKQNNLEWVTMVSWGYQDDIDSPIMTHHTNDSVQINNHNIHWQKRIEQVRAAGFKVFFKPHLWITSPSDGKWRSDIFPNNEENWESWKKTYRDFILRYAVVAEKANADMYCIGAEFSRLTVEKPEYWKKLIREIRSVYSGKITYAANWYNEFEKITFWDDLDYIGIQAYFPLTNNKYPSIKQISKGWEKYFPAMKSVHKKYNLKILFTEMGYKSTADSAVEPWIWLEDPLNQGKTFSPETQANCYQAFFNSVWEKEWFAGVHIWQMRSDFVKRPGKKSLNFTPQGKPAENIIAKGFKRNPPRKN